jgi:hypothetical protein
VPERRAAARRLGLRAYEAEAGEALRLQAARPRDDGTGDERQLRHRRLLVDNVTVEVIDRGRGTPRVEVGAKARGAADELGHGGEVGGSHLLRHERVGHKQHVLREERKLVGQHVVAAGRELQLDEALLVVADLAEVESVRVERRAHEALVVRLLGLCVTPCVEPLAEHLSKRCAHLAVAGVIHDELLVRGQVTALGEDVQEGVAKQFVVGCGGAQRPVAQDRRHWHRWVRVWMPEMLCLVREKACMQSVLAGMT